MASASVLNRVGSSALMAFLWPFLVNSAVILKSETEVKWFTSRSLSTINLTATDCTLPADKEGFTFRHKIGDNSKPTKRSKILRAC